MTKNKTCRVCGVALNEKNWYVSQRKRNYCICKSCNNEQNRQWRKTNAERHKAYYTKRHRNIGHRPYDENKECATYLGVHVAERVLSHVFKNVKRMPMHNPGYDVICNRNKKIDIKSSCLPLNNRAMRWTFSIGHNNIADYFLCLAFDNREDLNPLHVWLIPGNKLNHLSGTSITLRTLPRWDEYKLDIEKIVDCCGVLRKSNLTTTIDD